MPLGAKNQVAGYKAAVGRRNIGSDPAPSSMQRAKDTAIGHNRRNSGPTNSASSLAPDNAPRGRGSWEGYIHAPSTVIQMEGTGYLAKSAQKARGSKPGMNIADIYNRAPKFDTQSKGCMFDYTNCAKGSSIEKLNDHMELNNLFK
jgi:hypothetical protein